MQQNHTKSSTTVMPTCAAYRLLFVEDNDADAARIEEALRRDNAAVAIHRTRTLADAQRLLAAADFDVVLVSHELPDGDCFGLLNRLLQDALLLPVVVLTQYGHEDLAVSALKAGASDCIRKELDHRHLDGLARRLREAMQRYQEVLNVAERAHRQEQLKLMDSLRVTVASVKHEINNPLAIISGNAQLLLELSQIMDFEEDLVKPIRDIEEASLRITDSLDKLNSIKEIIAHDHLNGEETLNGLRYR